MREIEVITLGLPVAYVEMLARQKERRALVERGEAPNTLFVLEHLPVITCGRNTLAGNVLAAPEALAAQGVALESVDRGGDVTYHGPGQLVAYPILRLTEWKCSVSWYLRSLEQVLIDTLAGFGIEGWREKGYTGVWTAKGKVAAIGVGVHQWTTFHGIALNVSPDMGHFRLIVPCGIGDRPVTSMEALLGMAPELEAVRAAFVGAFGRVFGEGVERSE